MGRPLRDCKSSELELGPYTYVDPSKGELLQVSTLGWTSQAQLREDCAGAYQDRDCLRTYQFWAGTYNRS